MTPPAESIAANSPGQWWAGVADFWRGLGIVARTPALWPLAAVPFVINTVLLVALLAWAWSAASGWVEANWLTADAWWTAALGWALGIVFWIVTTIMVLMLFVPLASLIAGPFNDLISEKVERLLTGGSVDEAFSLRALWRGVILGLGTSLRLLALTSMLYLGALVVGFVPLVGPPLAAALTVAITIRFLALEYTAYSMDRRYYTHEQRRRFLRCHRARTIGLGCMAFVVMAIPVVNALFIPVTAAAGTVLFCETELRRG